MSATCYKRPHVDIFICIEMARERNRVIKKNTLYYSSQVVVLQEYTNNSSKPIEAKYVFPLDDNAVVCGFEAFINGKHVVGEVKEKQQAHKEYKEAIKQGHGAYLMDQEETPVGGKLI